MILKIYDGSGNHYIGDGDLLKTILPSELIEYHIVDELMTIDESYFRIINDGRYSSIYDRHDDGTTLGDIWRAYSDEGELILSGIITEVELSRDESGMIIRGKEWTSILARRIAENEVFTDQKGDYILTNATYGLIPKYLGTYNINVATYVDTPSNIIKQKYNGQSVYDCAVDCAGQSYGAGSKQFQFSIFEVDSAGSFTKYLWFKERESGSVAKTFYSWDLVPGSVEMSPSTLPLKNRIIVEGDVYKKFTPSDQDTWTESTSYWTAVYGDTITTDGGDKKEGSYSIKCTVNATGTEMYIDEEFYRSQKHPGREHKLSFFFKPNYRVADNDSWLIVVDIWHDNEAGGGPWLFRDTPIVEKDNWTLLTYDLNQVCRSDWHKITEVWIGLFADTPPDPIIKVDKFFFTNPDNYKYTKSPASQPYHDLYIKDFNLKSDAECQKVAEGIHKYRENADRYGRFQLHRSTADIKSGDSVAVKYSPKNLDISSIIVRRVEWGGVGGSDEQTVFVGRQYTQSEILQHIQQKIDKK